MNRRRRIGRRTVANGDEDDIMSAMSLDAVAEAEHLNDDTINEDED